MSSISDNNNMTTRLQNIISLPLPSRVQFSLIIHPLLLTFRISSLTALPYTAITLYKRHNLISPHRLIKKEKHPAGNHPTYILRVSGLSVCLSPHVSLKRSLAN